MYIENGRLDNGGPNGDQRKLVQHLLDTFPTEVIITPNQDIIFANLPEEAKPDFEKELDAFKYGKRNGKVFSQLRKLSGACVGRDTCRLTYTDSEKFEPELLDQLEDLGWGDLHTSIGITGCERQCFRPSTKTIGLVGTGLNRYQLRLFGTEDARNQGRPLYNEDRTLTYLRSIPREEVANVIDTLMKWHKSEAEGSEELGYFLRRIGEEEIISYLQEHETTKELMENTTKVKAYME
jgi:sulfite reductase (NADPH) hemoprotein beta-component